MDICKLAVAKFTNSIMERIRCFRFEGKEFKKPIPSRDEVGKIVSSIVADEKKFNELWEQLRVRVSYTPTEALFMAQPSGFTQDIIDDYLSGKDDADAKESGEPHTSTLDEMVENVIFNALDVATCNTHNLWDRDDSPNSLVFEFRGTELEQGLRESWGDTKADFERLHPEHNGKADCFEG